MIAILMLLCAAAFVALRFIGLGFVGCSYFVVNQQITPPRCYILLTSSGLHHISHTVPFPLCPARSGLSLY